MKKKKRIPSLLGRALNQVDDTPKGLFSSTLNKLTKPKKSKQMDISAQMTYSFYFPVLNQGQPTITKVDMWFPLGVEPKIGDLFDIEKNKIIKDYLCSPLDNILSKEIEGRFEVTSRTFKSKDRMVIDLKKL